MFRKRTGRRLRHAAAIAAIIMAALCLAGSGLAEADMPAAEAGGELWGVAADALAARTGPSTLYDGAGTYDVQGQRIRVLSRAYDGMSRSWWVKCEIPRAEETRVVWTLYKRFDSSTLPLESIPVEEVEPPVTPEPEPVPAEEPSLPETPVGDAPESGQQGGQADEQPGGQENAAFSGQWSSAYSSFIGSHRFLGMGQRYYESPSISMRDLDEDGIPEILAWNGADSWLYEEMSDPPAGEVYVYAWADGNIRYAGSFFEGGAYPDESVMALDGRSGLYIVKWEEPAETYRHIIMRDGQVISEPNTEPEDLFYEITRYLRWYTPEEINRIGCPLFLEAPFEMGTIDLDYTAGETYREGEPVRVNVSISGGRAPYEVSVYWYELDSDGMVLRDLAVDSFTTSESTLVREYWPESSAYTVGIEVYAKDVFGVPAYFDEPMMLEVRAN